MLGRKKRAPNNSLDAARQELQRALERDKQVTQVVRKTSHILEANHLAPKIRRAIRHQH